MFGLLMFGFLMFGFLKGWASRGEFKMKAHFYLNSSAFFFLTYKIFIGKKYLGKTMSGVDLIEFETALFLGLSQFIR